MGRFALGCLVLGACGFETAIPSIDGAQGVAADAAIDAPPQQLCTARYGAADSFELCQATPTSCRFYVQTNDASCDALCAMFGGTCINSHDGDCTTTSPTIRPCTATFGDQVCNCAP